MPQGRLEVEYLIRSFFDLAKMLRQSFTCPTKSFPFPIFRISNLPLYTHKENKASESIKNY